MDRRRLLREHLPRVLFLLAGVYVTFFAPEAWTDRFFVRLFGVIALLAGVLGPHRMGVLNTALVLGLVYLLALGPMRLVAWLRRDDALGLRTSGASFWRPKAAPAAGLTERQRARFQF